MDESVQMLTSLGLTYRQAKVYLSLVKLRIATVKTISAVSKIPRQHIYQVMSALQELGLVEKAITTPVMFRATVLHNAVSTLIEHKSEEYSRLRAEARNLLRKNEENNAAIAPPTMGASFILIPSSETISRIVNALENTQTSWDAIAPWKDHTQIMFRYATKFKEAMNRGVKFRYITDKPEDEKTSQRIMKDFKHYNSWEEKHVLTPIKVTLAVFDKRGTLVATSSMCPSKQPALWSNNPCVLEMVREYFDMKWCTLLDETTGEP